MSLKPRTHVGDGAAHAPPFLDEAGGRGNLGPVVQDADGRGIEESRLDSRR
jgi:hypothetical protein